MHTYDIFIYFSLPIFEKHLQVTFFNFVFFVQLQFGSVFWSTKKDTCKFLGRVTRNKERSEVRMAAMLDGRHT